MRYLLLLLLLLTLTACSTAGQMSINEKNAPGNLSSYDDSDIMNRLNDLKNGATPKMAANKKSTSQANRQKTPPPPPAPEQIKLENLVSQYNKAILKTNFGDIVLVFYNADSPLTVNNFLNLAKKNFYNETKFHRVIPDFMVQGGDPNSKDDDWSNDGSGGPGYKFADEFNSHKLVRGSLAMANSGPNTNGSQFFIVTKESTPWLDGKHTNFGYVVEGMDVVDQIEKVKTNANDHPTEDVIIKEIELMAASEEEEENKSIEVGEEEKGDFDLNKEAGEVNGAAEGSQTEKKSNGGSSESGVGTKMKFER